MYVCVQDARFDSGMDAIENYRSKSILCVPILNVNQQVIGVARGVNKGGEVNPQPFDPSDVRIFRTYLAFCGICLINAQLYNRSRLESKRSKVRKIPNQFYYFILFSTLPYFFE